VIGWAASALTFRAPVVAAIATAHSLAGMGLRRRRFGPRAAHCISATAPFSRDREKQHQPSRTNFARLGLACSGGVYGRNREATTGQVAHQVEASGIDIMLVLDVSNSMLVKISPSWRRSDAIGCCS